MPTRGGRAELWLEPEEEVGAYAAAFFSVDAGSQKLLSVQGRSSTEPRIVALDRATGQREVLAAGRNPVYAPSGHVVYDSLDPKGIWAAPFSVDTMKATGNPFPISKDGREPSIAPDGTLVNLEGAGASGLTRLIWRDREGNRLGEIGEPHEFTMSVPELSPDGLRAVVSDRNYDLWIHQVNRPIKTRLLDSPAREIRPIWSPRGDRIAFSSAPGARLPRSVYVAGADGSEDRVPVVESAEWNDYVTDWSADGNNLLITRAKVGEGNNLDLWYLQRREGGGWKEIPFLRTQYDEQLAKLSPDGRFIAYESNESGQREVYVRSFPDGRSLHRVSADGGAQVRWRRDGGELFYVEGDSLMAVPITTSPTLTIGSAERLFSDDSLPSRASHEYEATRDGQRFILCETEEGISDARIRVVLNWPAEFEDRARD